MNPCNKNIINSYNVAIEVCLQESICSDKKETKKNTSRTLQQYNAYLV